MVTVRFVVAALEQRDGRSLQEGASSSEVFYWIKDTLPGRGR